MKGNAINLMLFALISLTLAILILNFFNKHFYSIKNHMIKSKAKGFFYEFRNALTIACEEGSYNLTSEGYGNYVINNKTVCENEFNLGCFNISCPLNKTTLNFPDGVKVNIYINHSSISKRIWNQ